MEPNIQLSTTTELMLHFHNVLRDLKCPILVLTSTFSSYIGSTEHLLTSGTTFIMISTLFIERNLYTMLPIFYLTQVLGFISSLLATKLSPGQTLSKMMHVFSSSSNCLCFCALLHGQLDPDIPENLVLVIFNDIF